MKKLGRGAIINVASIAGFLPYPASAMYAASKAFLITFSESLFMELAPFGIKVQVLCPGFTRTDFHGRLGLKSSELKSRGIVTWMSAKKVVAISLKKLRGHKPICVPGFWNRVIYVIVRRVPKRLYYFSAGAVKVPMRK
jgi:short-subunit dehydrogenase